MNPLVSICCITYNHEKYISEALDSFLIQKTDFEFEIIIHDDASTDRTADIIRAYEKKYPDIIRPIYQTENQYSKGVQPLFTCFLNAQGNYIALCEGDDYWTDQNKLQIQVNYMEKHPECSLCCHAAEYIKEDGSFIGVDNPFHNDLILSSDDLLWKKKSIISTNSMLFRTKYFNAQIPQFMADAPVGDLPLQMMLFTKGTVYYIKNVLSAHRLEAIGSWSSNMKKGNVTEKQLLLCSRLETMYHQYNLYTGDRYIQSVQIAIHGLQFLQFLYKKEYAMVKKKKYRIFYKRLTLRNRFSIGIVQHLPKLHSFLRKLKNM